MSKPKIFGPSPGLATGVKLPQAIGYISWRWIDEKYLPQYPPSETKDAMTGGLVDIAELEWGPSTEPLVEFVGRQRWNDDSVVDLVVTAKTWVMAGTRDQIHSDSPPWKRAEDVTLEDCLGIRYAQDEGRNRPYFRIAVRPAAIKKSVCPDAKVCRIVTVNGSPIWVSYCRDQGSAEEQGGWILRCE